MILSGVTNRDEHVSTWPGHVSILMSQFHQFASCAFYAFYYPAMMPFTGQESRLWGVNNKLPPVTQNCSDSYKNSNSRLSQAQNRTLIWMQSTFSFSILRFTFMYNLNMISWWQLITLPHIDTNLSHRLQMIMTFMNTRFRDAFGDLCLAFG